MDTGKRREGDTTGAPKEVGQPSGRLLPTHWLKTKLQKGKCKKQMEKRGGALAHCGCS